MSAATGRIISVSRWSDPSAVAALPAGWSPDWVPEEGLSQPPPCGVESWEDLQVVAGRGLVVAPGLVELRGGSGAVAAAAAGGAEPCGAAGGPAARQLGEWAEAAVGLGVTSVVCAAPAAAPGSATLWAQPPPPPLPEEEGSGGLRVNVGTTVAACSVAAAELGGALAAGALGLTLDMGEGGEGGLQCDADAMLGVFEAARALGAPLLYRPGLVECGDRAAATVAGMQLAAAVALHPGAVHCLDAHCSRAKVVDAAAVVVAEDNYDDEDLLGSCPAVEAAAAVLDLAVEGAAGLSISAEPAESFPEMLELWRDAGGDRGGFGGLGVCRRPRALPKTTTFLFGVG